jgi:hypothetical protein
VCRWIPARRIIDIEFIHNAGLPQIAVAFRRNRFGFGPVQGWQQHRCQYRNDRDHDKQLNQSETC